MRDYDIINDGLIRFGNFDIILDHGGNNDLYHADPNVIFMAKGLGYLKDYRDIDQLYGFRDRKDLNILELGVYSGGSAVFIDQRYQPKKLVCIDFKKDRSKPLDDYIAKTSAPIACYYDTNQADRKRLQEIIVKEFDGPIDFVIDDASHWYNESRASFETVFPYVATEGIYAIEDWNWAHCVPFQTPDSLWWDQPGLSNLIFRLVALHGGDREIIPNMGFSRGPMWVQKGHKALDKDAFSLDAWEHPRGKPMPLI